MKLLIVALILLCAQLYAQQGIIQKKELLPTVDLFKGTELAANGNFAEAKTYFEQYFSFYHYGYISIRDKIYIKLFKDIEDKSLKTEAAKYIFKGISFGYDKYNFSEYIFYLNRASALHPDYTIPYILRGELHLSREEYKQAIFEFKKALEKDSKCSIAYYYLGKIYNHFNDFNSALSNLNYALIYDDKMVDAYLERYKLYFYNDIFELALRDFDSVYQIDSTQIISFSLEHSSNLNSMGIEFLQNEEYTNAIDAFTLSIIAGSRWPESYINRAKVYSIEQKYELALRDLNQALQLKPDSPEIYYSRALCYLDMDEVLKAEKDLTQVIFLDDQNSKANFQLGQLYYKQNNYDKAIFYFEKSLKLDPENIWSRYWLGYCFDKKRDIVKALSYYREFYRLVPDKYAQHRESIYHRIKTLKKYQNK